MTIPAAFVDYFRCPSEFAPFECAGGLSATEGYFRWGDVTCYGRHMSGEPSGEFGPSLYDVSPAVRRDGSAVILPFDLTEVATNLRYERFRQRSPHLLETITSTASSRSLYYLLRPLLGIGVRRHLQKIRLAGWERIDFPRWPVDVTVERLMRSAMALALEGHEASQIPFIWFWPDGADGCAMVTHDVEGVAGLDFCRALMDLDDACSIKSAFQMIPEGRGEVSDGLRDEMRARGFEVNIHDLNHDGYLFHDRQEFLKRAARLNAYARRFGSRGFRSAAMYRRQEWYEALQFAYDMSVPNVAHLEPQRGGCCTVMPYFVGEILELPLTTVQDYSLFHILEDYSIALWKEQTDRILSHNGLVSFLTHPDYLTEPRARATYNELLLHVRQLREESSVWVALPGEIDRWWRQRHGMRLVRAGDSWQIEGAGAERARVAFATIEAGRVVYERKAAPGEPRTAIGGAA